MESLHIVKKNPTNIEDPVISESKFEKAQHELSRYLTQLKETKDKSSFEAHEAVIVRLVNRVGQAALLDALSHYDEDMPLGFQLTDFYHVSEQLKAALDAAYPKDSKKAKAKFEHYKVILREEVGGVKKVLRALRHLRDQHKENAIIASNVTYFTNNQHRMRYAEAKVKNYPIGSGVVEASCKTLVGQRLKRAGMSWHHSGGQGVLTFRSLIKSQRFDKAWPFIANQYKQKIVEHTNVIYLVAQNVG